jgi:DivIVA domain-containing protein
MAGAQEGFGASGIPVTVGPMDVQQKEFHVSRFGGYRMRDVDEFLDEITTSLTTLLAENERLRTQATSGPVLGTPDLDDVGRQADEIIARARDEAAQILADARAGAVTAGVMAAGGGDRAAVNAFLVQEREFLQGLAALVQGHADGVKQMAKAARSAPAAAAPAVASEPAPATEEPPVDDTPADETPAAEAPAGGAHIAAQDRDEEEGPDDGGAHAAHDEAATIRIDDPQPATATPGDRDDGSLRELFWGEED